MIESARGIITVIQHCYAGKGVAFIPSWSNIDNQAKPEKYVLMEFTGAYDEKKEEIYECDIVEIKTLMPADNDIYDTEVVVSGIVIWHEEYCQYVIKSDKCYYGFDYMDNSRWMKKIGNIYENPELVAS